MCRKIVDVVGLAGPTLVSAREGEREGEGESDVVDVGCWDIFVCVCDNGNNGSRVWRGRMMKRDACLLWVRVCVCFLGVGSTRKGAIGRGGERSR